MSTLPTKRPSGAQNEDRKARPPIERLTHLVFLTACLASFSLIPVFLLRSRHASQMKEISELKASQMAFQKTIIKGNRDTRAALDKIQLVLIENRRREEKRGAVEEGIRRDVNELLHERQHTNKSQAELLKDLGMSLADIAAFMQEVEIRHGFVPKKDDGRGIERIRQMALRLQGIFKGEERDTNAGVDGGRNQDPESACRHEKKDTEAQDQTRTQTQAGTESESDNKTSKANKI